MANKRVALVTGASYGIGAAATLALARQGFDLVVAATRVENLAATVSRVQAGGGRAVPFALDLRSPASIEQVVPQIVRELGGLDVLVNNAAANLRRRAADVSREEWNDVIETNVTGTFFLTQQVGRAMIASKRPGSIVNIASVHGIIGVSERSTYGISKAALIQMTRMLAIEWAEHDIRVNAIAPGRLLTESPSRAGTGSDPNYMAAMLSRIPLHRFATVEEVADAVCYLAGPRAGSVTGHTLVLDGGLTIA